MTTPYLDHDGLTLLEGDAAARLAELDDASVDMAFTSPPFYGLRDYGTGEWEGGDLGCKHKFEVGGTARSTLDVESWLNPETIERKIKRAVAYRHECRRCGATRTDEQIGLEADPLIYIDRLVGLFDDVRRVLRPWGVLLVEIGDSHADRANPRSDGESFRDDRADVVPPKRNTIGGPLGLKAQDLIGIPFLFALAMRSAGWHFVATYIWDKTNPMPESTTRRCTTSHSYVFHFARSGKPKFWTHRDLPGTLRRPKPDFRWIHRETGEETAEPQQGKEWRRINLWSGYNYFWDALAIAEPASNEGGGRQRAAGTARYQDAGFKSSIDWSRPTDRFQTGSLNATRNARSVWRISTETKAIGLCAACRAYWPRNAPKKHCGVEVIAHYAAFPVELAEKAILAASSEGGVCSGCRAPWTRVVEKGELELAANTWSGRGGGSYDIREDGWAARGAQESSTLKHVRAHETVGWRPTCECGLEPVPAVVLDPFGGSGTVLVAARRLGRRGVAVELNPDYCEMTARRLEVPDVVERAAETSTEPIQLVLGADS